MNSTTRIDKVQLLASLRSRLATELESATTAQQSTQAGAVHEESRPEDPKDTRALEATYLARGLAERVVMLQNAKIFLEGLQPRAFGDEDEIAVGAVVALQDEASGVLSHYFIAPIVGGWKVRVGALEVTTLTPTAPLGRALVGMYCDDPVEIHTPSGVRNCVIREVY